MLTDQRQYLQHLQITSDLICFALLYLLFLPLVMSLVNGQTDLLFSLKTTSQINHTFKSFTYLGYAFILVAVSGLIAAMASALCHPSNPGILSVVAWSAVITSIASGLIWWMLLELDLSDEVRTSTFIIATPLLYLCLVLNRIYILLSMQKSQTHSYLIKYVAIAGTDAQSIELGHFIQNHPETGLRLVGCLSSGDKAGGGFPPDLCLLGATYQLPSIVQAHVIDLVLVVNRQKGHPQMDFLFKTCATMGIELLLKHTETYRSDKGYRSQETLNGIVFNRYSFVFIKPRSAFLKRTFDFCGATALIFCCIPFWIVVPILIKSNSAGPVFFRQERIGKSGRKFILYKFRSMKENAEAMQEDLMHLNEMDGPAFKIKNDPRQTPTGKILRKYSLDELPQLFNVFLGDISLVGPRPAKENEVLEYRPRERRRLSVIQGITCIWQISGRNDIKFDEWMKLDLIYIDHWSTVSDFKILFKTVPAVLMKRGAY